MRGYCNVVWCVAVWCGVLQCVNCRCSMLRDGQCGAVCCSVQCVVGVLQYHDSHSCPYWAVSRRVLSENTESMHTPQHSATQCNKYPPTHCTTLHSTATHLCLLRNQRLWRLLLQKLEGWQRLIVAVKYNVSFVKKKLHFV